MKIITQKELASLAEDAFKNAESMVSILRAQK